ncbi:MBL fold metallo-hydrolase [Comamonas composti]|uniref:MBL fold metallo-hydrolase n=1 Tax=Comamonas composti TaxID=408558 RepID=UPI0003FCE2BB|nr:MBL fold metallo-hydrolase [Comamonas composti]
MFKLTFLGTSSGVPTRSRNVSGLAVQAQGLPGWMLVDCGEGTQQRVQSAGLSLHELRAVCITHVHGDHCYGLPGLLASTGMGKRSQPLTLVAPQPVWDWLQATRVLTDLHLPYEIVHVDPQALADGAQVFVQGGLRITRHALAHRVPSDAYRFALREERVRLRVDALRALGVAPGPD